ncbi:M15 family metallopeptidase [Paenibacillus ginsengarvi]|nr:M15 family metallopeptidase [Paenibacillus ginsengarvi]
MIDHPFHKAAAALLLAGCLFGLAACAGEEAAPANTKPSDTAGQTIGKPGGDVQDGDKTQGQTAGKTPDTGSMAKPGDPSGTSGQTAGKGTEAGSGTKPGAGNDGKTAGGGSATGGKSGDAVQVVAKPADIAVLVNKTYKLPDNFKPDDLVEPNIPFIFKEKSEKRLMRKEAAGALEKLVAAAKKDGISLAGVSGYRSQATQKTLFENYVKKDGEEAARKYSAVPGHSEHQTGLAMDVSGSDGKCAASDCFAGTKEAKWLAEHAAEHGFIIRYPKGKEETTGYQYEPWHLRFVGTKIAKDIADKGITLEEYMLNAVPVSK